MAVVGHVRHEHAHAVVQDCLGEREKGDDDEIAKEMVLKSNKTQTLGRVGHETRRLYKLEGAGGRKKLTINYSLLYLA